MVAFETKAKMIFLCFQQLGGFEPHFLTSFFASCRTLVVNVTACHKLLILNYIPALLDGRSKFQI